MIIKSKTVLHCKKIIECLSKGGHAGTISNIIVDAVEVVLNYERQRLASRKCNIPTGTDLLTEQIDEMNRSRYKLAAIDDEPVMVPCMDGYWMPAYG